MMKSDYKKKYEELLIEHHKKKYIHIPFSWAGIGRFFLFIGSIILTWLFSFVLVGNWKLLNIAELLKPDVEMNVALIGYHQWGIIPNILFMYILISLCAICFCALVKGGFDKLKTIDENGLVTGLVTGLVVGLVVGLVTGLVTGLVVWLVTGLVRGLVVWLVVGLVVWLVVGLVGEFSG